MAFRFVALFAFVAAASAGAIDYHQPQYYHQPEYHQAAAPVLVKKVVVPTYAKQQDYEAPAKYEFNYAVSDEHTGDIKNQQEARDGDNVHGSYSLIDADGFKRTVEYTADEHNGFQATVHREPISGYKAPVVPVQKYVAAAPITKVVAAAPAYYSAAPVAKVVAAAPAYYSAAPVAKIVAAAPVVAKYAAPAYYNHAAPAYNYHH